MSTARRRRMGAAACATVAGLVLLGTVPTATPARADDATSPAAAPSANAAPGSVTVTARLEPDTTTIGTPFRYTTEITAPTGVQIVLAQPTERIGQFDILDFGDAPPVTHAGVTTVTRWYSLAGWEPGHYEIASPPVQWRRTGEELAPAPGATVVMTIESVLAKAGAPTDIRDIKPPLDPPIDWRPWQILGLTVAIALLLGWAAYRFLHGRQATVAAPPPRPAHELALADLDRLRARRLTEQGRFKEYYSALSDIVRAYVERRFGVRAPEMTTEEFLLTTARGGRLAAAQRSLLGEFLGQSDLVKFARLVPTLVDSEGAWTAARRFVEDTAEAPAEGIRAAR
ncbi:MAG TPA: hypothetical protein VGK30_11455 [Candidatus Binatia bacterium]